MSSIKTKISWILLILVVLIGLSFSGSKANAQSNTTIINTTLNLESIGNETNILTYIYAEYEDENTTVENAQCLINSYNMQFNQTNYYYITNITEQGNYTFEVVCSKFDYQNQSKNIIIEIFEIVENETVQNITIDNDNDTYPEDLDCDDYDPNINPGQNEILYNGLDDDCNPFTYDYIVFDVRTKKSSYSPGESVKIKINATNRSDTYITINTPTNVSYIYMFNNGSYPVEQEFSLTDLSGQYSIEATNYYDNYTNNDYYEFSVDNTLNAEIHVDDNEIYVGEEIELSVTVTGAIGDYNLIWNMDDDNEIYEEDFEYNYSSARDYNIVLMVTDQGGNQVIKVEKIKVKPLYYLTIEIKDKDTNDLLEDIKIKLDSDVEYTNESGKVRYKATNKTYELKVLDDKYKSYEEDIKINTTTNLKIKIEKNPEKTPPVITITSPNNGSVISKPEFKFKINDDSNAECFILISQGDGWWLDYNNSDVEPNKQHVFSLNLDPGKYYWKIECIDEDDNVAYSEDRVVNISENIQDALLDTSSKEPDTTYTIIQNIYDLIPDFDTYSPDEKKIVELLKLDVVIKDSKRRLQMSNRDLYNLGKEPDTESVLNKRNDIYATIDQIKDTTPRSIKLIDKVEFVKYNDESSVQDLIKEYLAYKYPDLTEKEKKNFIEQNKELQKKLTVQTYAYNTEITYVSGRSKQVTIISRNLEFDTLTTNLNYVEFIPKNLIESTDDIIFITNPDKILNPDPVFEYKARDLSKVIYYFNESVLLDIIPKIKPIIISMEEESSKSNSVTGFSIFNSIGFSESNTKIFLIEIVVVLILLGIYLYFYFTTNKDVKITKNPLLKSSQISSSLKQKSFKEDSTKSTNQPVINQTVINPQVASHMVNAINDSHKVDYLNKIISITEQLVLRKNLKQAALKYHEIKFLYDLLDESDKSILFNRVISLSDEITFNHIEALLEEAIVELAQGNHNTSLNLYSEIQLEFEKLSLEYQDKIYPKCCELALHLRKQ